MLYNNSVCFDSAIQVTSLACYQCNHLIEAMHVTTTSTAILFVSEECHHGPTSPLPPSPCPPPPKLPIYFIF